MEPLFSADSTPTVFISYAAEDGDFVQLLAAVLQFHKINVSYDAAGVSGNAMFPAAGIDALRESDSLAVVVSRSTAESPRVADEVTLFRQVLPEAPIVRIMLTALDYATVLPKLDYQPVDFSDCLLEGFERFLQVFDRPFLRAERRRAQRRKAPQDGNTERRVGPPARRLRRAFREHFYRETGISERQDFDLSVVNLHKTIDALREESRRYEYRDAAGAHIDPTAALECAVHAVWQDGYGADHPLPAVYVIEAVAEELAKAANPRSLDRRSDRSSDSRFPASSGTSRRGPVRSAVRLWARTRGIVVGCRPESFESSLRAHRRTEALAQTA